MQDVTANCSACGAVVCEPCADRDSCRHDGCENVYCVKCAVGFLPVGGAGCCVPCINRFAAVPLGQFFESLSDRQKDAVTADVMERVVTAALGRAG